MKNADMPIYPTDPIEDSGEPYYKLIPQYGLTKREHFAAMAMQGMLSSTYMLDFSSEVNDDSYDILHGLANNAVQYADALLEELSK